MTAIRLMLFAIVFSSFSPLTKSCELNFNSGPFYSTSYVSSIFQNFFNQVNKETGCNIIFSTSKNIEEYYSKTLNHEVDFIVAADEAGAAFKVYGFDGLFITDPIFSILIVINPSKVTNVSGGYDLTGKSFSSVGNFSLTHTVAEQFFEKKGVKVSINTVNHLFNGPIEFLKKQHDGVITSDFVYKNFPEAIKNKYTIIHQSKKHATSVLVSNKLSPMIIQSLQRNIHLIKKVPYKKYRTYKIGPHTKKVSSLLNILAPNVE